MKELTNFYLRITTLGSLQKNDVVFLGDQPDARTCTFLEEVRIARNWPSQWHSCYPEGYIGFEDGRLFDLAREQVAGRPAYLFLWNPAIMDICQRLEAENRLLHLLAGCKPEESVVIAQLVLELAGTPAWPIQPTSCRRRRNRSWASSMVDHYPGWTERTFRERLRALSIREVKTLADLLEGQVAQESMTTLAA